MTRNLYLILAVGFALFLAVVVALADLGRGTSIMKWVTYLPGGDFTGHLLLLGTMSLLLNGALQFKTFPWKSWNILMGTAILLSVATLEETSHLFLVSRSFSLYDMLGNTIGIIAFGEIGRWLTPDDSRDSQRGAG